VADEPGRKLRVAQIGAAASEVLESIPANGIAMRAALRPKLAIQTITKMVRGAPAIQSITKKGQERSERPVTK
jgi:hypothetical protein